MQSKDVLVLSAVGLNTCALTDALVAVNSAKFRGQTKPLEFIEQLYR